jgi:hypothetical protein
MVRVHSGLPFFPQLRGLPCLFVFGAIQHAPTPPLLAPSPVASRGHFLALIYRNDRIGRSKPEVSTRIETVEEQVIRAVAGAMRSLRPGYEEVRLVAADACIYVLDQSFKVAKRVRKQARQVKQEHPLELLCGITVGAFVLGMAIRIWRSKSYEYRD